MLLLIGFPKEEIERIKERMNEDVLPVTAHWENDKLKDIIGRDAEEYERLGEQRIVIMHDVEKSRISQVMRDVRSMVEEHVIFATSTPTSLEWEIYKLVEELIEEDQYFRSR